MLSMLLRGRGSSVRYGRESSGVLKFRRIEWNNVRAQIVYKHWVHALDWQSLPPADVGRKAHYSKR